jgi:D-glycero-D-manno-heptose 1,7-bisphosphate phosphatase
MKRTAVFLDRDGTIIEDAGYVGDPQQVRLIRDAADAIRRFRQAGHLVVIVSNQSGVARGFFDEATMNDVHARVVSLLAARGADVDRAYYCPYLDGPEATVEAYRRDSELRKPKPGMLLLAAKELDIDLSRSWMIGDSPADVEAGSGAGCRTILLRHNGAAPRAADTAPTHCVDSLTAAVELVELDMRQDLDSKADAPAADRGHGDPVVSALERIHDQLERAHRKERQHDFSFLRLLGALLQMLAVVAALWGVIALMDDQSAPATARLTLACFFQLAAVTAFAIDRFR